MVIPLQSPGMGLQSGRADLDAATAHPPWTRWLCEPARAPSGLCGSFVTLSLVTWRFPTVHWYGCNRGLARGSRHKCHGHLPGAGPLCHGQKHLGWELQALRG